MTMTVWMIAGDGTQFASDDDWLTDNPQQRLLLDLSHSLLAAFVPDTGDLLSIANPLLQARSAAATRQRTPRCSLRQRQQRENI